MLTSLLTWIEISCLVGLLYSPVSLGLAWAFRVLNFPDLTCEGSFMLGGAISIAILNGTGNITLSIVGGILAGFVAGILTATIHIRFHVSRLLSGVVVWALLYSVTLRILGGVSNLVAIPATLFGDLTASKFEYFAILVAFFAVATLIIGLSLLGRSRLGRLTRAYGDQPWFTSSLGISPTLLELTGLGLANALIAASGILICHFKHLSDVNMSAGVLISGLASVMIGEAIFNPKNLFQHTLAVVCGSIIYNMAISAFYFEWGSGIEGLFIPSDVRLVSGLMLLVPAAVVARRRRYKLYASEW